MPASVPSGCPKKEASWGPARETDHQQEAGGWGFEITAASEERREENQETRVQDVGLLMSPRETTTRRQVQQMVTTTRHGRRVMAVPMEGVTRPIAAMGRSRSTSSRRSRRRTRSSSRRCRARTGRATERAKAKSARMSLIRAVFALT